MAIPVVGEGLMELGLTSPEVPCDGWSPTPLDDSIKSTLANSSSWPLVSTAQGILYHFWTVWPSPQYSFTPWDLSSFGRFR